MIDQLDERRAQVYIESLIVEVTGDNAADFGFQWQGLLASGNGNNGIVGGTNFGTTGNLLSITQAQLGTGDGGSGISLGEGLNIGLVHNFFGTYGLAAIARLLQSQANTNIASTPNLVTLDNEEAKIVVGSNVPFVTGQFTQHRHGAVEPVPDDRAQGRRHHAAHPAADRRERHDPDDDLPGVVEPVAACRAGDVERRAPTTNKRSIESNVVVDDGQILVLGGLIEDRYTDNTSKVPLLGDIPYLGALFRSESRTKTRTNLMVFLRPVVMRDAETANRLSLDRYEQIRGFQKDMQPPPSLLVPINDSPVVPPMRRIDDAGQPLAAPQSSPGTRRPRGPTEAAERRRADGERPDVPPPVIARRRAAPPASAPAPSAAEAAWAPAIPALRLRQGAHAAARGRRRAPRPLGARRRSACRRSPKCCACTTSTPSSASRPSTLAGRIAAAYAGGESSAAVVIGEVESAVDLSRMMQELPAIEDLLEASNDAPIIRMLNALLTQAAKDGASDIHIEPYERSSSVRFRVDGTLREVVQPNRALHAALISRLKIMAELDIAERRLPQDGRISLRIGGRAVDVRVSTLPSAHGERAVLRLLDKAESKFTLEGLGMSGDVLTKFDRLIQQPHGIILVTGPTGSGKTTTLYASLGRVDTAGTNVLTVEDPVEYELAGIGQTQVNAKIDLTFAKALRAILRQDPDVIMIGEIRDYETAQIAIQASLTGHLVLATVHTNDAPSTVTRMIDMGVEPFLLSSSLIGVLAQRLVRKLCLALPQGRRAGPLAPGRLRPVRHDRLQGPHRRLRADGRSTTRSARLIHGRAAESQIFVAAPKRRGCARCARTASGWSPKASRRRRSDARHARVEGPRCPAACPRHGPAMPAYRFEALDAAGKSQSGLLDADNSRAARSQLRAQALVPLAVTQVVSAGTAPLGFSFTRKVFNATGLAVWTRQLAGLVGSGLPLERALTALSRRGRGPAPARARRPPAQRGQRRRAVRARAGERAARVRRRLSRRRRRRRAERRARPRPRAPRRRPRGAPGAEGPADRRDALSGDRLGDRGRHRRLPRHLRRAAGGDRVHQLEALAAAAHDRR